MKHAMHWINKAQRFGCTCGEVLYEGGEHRSRAQHREHKQGIPTKLQLADALRQIADFDDGRGPGRGTMQFIAQRALHLSPERNSREAT